MNGSIYKPLMDSMRWSYSRITSYENCPYSWYLKYLYGEEEQSNFYSSYGSFVHKLLERFFKGKISQKSLATEFLSAFHLNVSGRKPGTDIVSRHIESGYNYFREFNGFKYDMASVEERLSFDVDGVEFVGVIDYLGRDDDGGLVIVDHKSRDLKKRSKRSKPTKSDEELSRYLRQLYLYSIGVHKKYGEYPTKLCFNCFKSGVFIEEPFSIDTMSEVKEWALSLVSFISKQEDFQPNLDWFYCTNLCGFRDICCYYNDLIGGKAIASRY